MSELNDQVRAALRLLGHKVKDKVTGFSGIVHHVGFDLYGCVQAIVHPGTDDQGKLLDTQWFDVKRLTITSRKPVMPVPDFAAVPGGGAKPPRPETPR